jgi:hypothetical protein
MAGKEINLNYNEDIDIVLPDGQRVSILLSYLEPDEQLPEIDIKFPAQVSANCFLEALEPAVAEPPGAHVIEVRQIVVPIPRLSMK